MTVEDIDKIVEISKIIDEKYSDGISVIDIRPSYVQVYKGIENLAKLLGLTPTIRKYDFPCAYQYEYKLVYNNTTFVQVAHDKLDL